LATDSAGVDYRLIYVIHGDGNYLYHDKEGRRLKADEEQLQEAIMVAKRAKHGEVFIFHQQPEERFLWLFPKKDRHLLHFKNGERLHSEKYSPKAGQRHFEKEAELYHQFRSNTPSTNVLLYYGHEIPDQQYEGYFQSRPRAAFDIQHFSDGLNLFLEDQDRFDLTVLSTCDNGTPNVVSALQGQTDYLLASPENLHLSHIDSEPLLQLEQPDKSIVEVSRSIGQATYDRLADFLQTVITLAIYDMDQVQGAAKELLTAYGNYRVNKEETTIEQENVDCASLSFWDGDSSHSKGIEVFFKPPAFGSQVNQDTHSGWGCQP
jgi:hypothetical protein